MMLSWRLQKLLALMVFIALICSGAALAQSTPAPPAPAPVGPPRPEPTLDDLLGIPSAPRVAKPDAPAKPGETPDGPANPPSDGPVDAAKRALDRSLNEDGSGDDFEQAVALMDQSAELLEKGANRGLDTQRLQEQTLEKLDKLIADAQKSKGGGKSKPKPKPDDSSSQSKPQPQSSQQQQQQSNASQAGMPNIPRQDGATGPTPPANSASWGNLPEHVRQSLTQGLGDKFSSMYRQLTEQYYKRLAEEPHAGGHP